MEGGARLKDPLQAHKHSLGIRYGGEEGFGSFPICQPCVESRENNVGIRGVDLENIQASGALSGEKYGKKRSSTCLVRAEKSEKDLSRTRLEGSEVSKKRSVQEKECACLVQIRYESEI